MTSLTLHLVLISSILLCCNVTKSYIKYYQLHFLPQAGGCIIIGAFVGFASHFFFGDYVHDNEHFNGEVCLSFLLPPIIFEAALSVNKTQFRKKRLPIFMLAILGTFISTILTGVSIYYFTKYVENTPTFPLVDSLAYGALISSVDPVAILSIMSDLKVPNTHPTYILVFGESLLNDGIAITLFKSLVMNTSVSWDIDYIYEILADFVITFFGSAAIALLFGVLSIVYFWVLHKKLNSVMEVASFLLWALVPYYICDALELSGIVALVTIGFFLDIYVGEERLYENQQVQTVELTNISEILTESKASTNFFPPNDQRNVTSKPTHIEVDNSSSINPSLLGDADSTVDYTYATRNLIFSRFKYKMSTEAYCHVRFLTHLLASLSEDAIFVYLGIFLFDANYEWNIRLLCLSIVSCILSRIIMVTIVSYIVWYVRIMWNFVRYQHWEDTAINGPIHDDVYVLAGLKHLKQQNEDKVKSTINSSVSPQTVTSLPLIFTPSKDDTYAISNIQDEDLKEEENIGSMYHLYNNERNNTHTEVKNAGISELQSRPVQLVIILAGLRGAVSFALAASMPEYDYYTEVGTTLKPEILAMTSSTIVFTIFVVGGASHYILQGLQIF